MSLLRTVAHRKIVLLDNARTCNLIEPIGITCTHCGILVEEHVHRQRVQHGVTVFVVAPVEVVTQIVVVRIYTIVHRGLPEGTPPLAGVHRLNLVRIKRGSHTGIEVYLHFTLLTFLRGNDNHTIGSTRTVDTGRGGILQHLNRLDIIAIQLMHTSLRGYTVNDVQRVVVVQRSDTTNANGGSTRRITIGRDVHTRHTTLHGLDGVVLVLLSQIRGTHRRDGTRQVGLALAGITCYHHFLYHQCVILHHYLHSVLCGQFL